MGSGKVYIFTIESICFRYLLKSILFCLTVNVYLLLISLLVSCSLDCLFLISALALEYLCSDFMIGRYSLK